jgi:hypothetical protein
MSVRRYPQLVNAYALADKMSIMRSCAALITINDKQVWVPARALGFASVFHAAKLAWGVFRGRYDALVWPGQGDDEDRFG